MLRAMDSAVAGLRSHQNKLDVIGNNIANVNTLGFKAQSYSFKEAMYQTSTASTGGTDSAAGNNAAQYGYGTMTGTIAMDMIAGIPTYVGNFNAVINGQGFFIVRSNKADITNEDLKSSGCSFTRVGQFTVDNNGYIVDSGNNFVFGFLKEDPDDPDSSYQTDTLKPLSLTDVEGNIIEGDDDEPAIASSIEINNMGIITAKITDQDGNEKTVTIGKVAIASFQNPEGLTKSGGHYFTTNGNDNAGDCTASEPGSGSTPSLMTGYVEGSNVDLAKEFSELIMAQRGFQANSKIITVSDEILNELVNMKR